jgi:regulator of protease activity HflC (stomatin/prohibitin superfamily)
MYTKIRVKLNERVVAFRDGLVVRALGPGRHLLFGTRYTEQRFDTDKLTFRALPEVRAALPSEWFTQVTLAKNERGVLYRDAVPVAYLRPGTHWYWTLDPSVALEILSIDEPMAELTDELARIVPAAEYLSAIVREHERGLFYVKGRLERVLDPGRYFFWSQPTGRVAVQIVDMRREQLQLVGQDLMTKDKVTLRLSLTVEHAVEDAAKMATSVTSARDSVYLAVQLAARDYVASVTLDELLEGRDAMTRYLEKECVPKARAFGVRIDGVGVKDVVLPGEMRVLLNRVIEAEKEAAANVILRREEAAATRSMANTAKVLADHPVLLRMKELESLEKIAAQVGEVRLVLGTEGLEKLAALKLLGRGDA